MAKKTAPTKTETPKLTDEQLETKKQILQLTSKRHVKIYLLSSLVGIKGKEIAASMSTNQGHVGNVLRDYAEHADKQTTARDLWEKHLNADKK